MHGADQGERLVVVHLREAQPVVLRADLHAERAEFLQAPDHRVRDPRVALDHRGVDLRLAELSQPRQERLATLRLLRRTSRMRMDQIQPEPAEEQLFAETWLIPVRFTRLLGNLSGLSFVDFFADGHRRPPCVGPYSTVTPLGRGIPRNRPDHSVGIDWKSKTDGVLQEVSAARRRFQRW